MERVLPPSSKITRRLLFFGLCLVMLQDSVCPLRSKLYLLGTWPTSTSSSSPVVHTPENLVPALPSRRSVIPWLRVVVPGAGGVCALEAVVSGGAARVRSGKPVEPVPVVLSPSPEQPAANRSATKKAASNRIFLQIGSPKTRIFYLSRVVRSGSARSLAR